MRWHYYSICCVFTQREAQVKQLERGPKCGGPMFPGSHRLVPQVPKWLGKPDWLSPENTLFTTLSWASKPGVRGGVLKRHEKPLLKAETAETLQRSKDKLNDKERRQGLGNSFQLQSVPSQIHPASIQVKTGHASDCGRREVNLKRSLGKTSQLHIKRRKASSLSIHEFCKELMQMS